MDSGEDGSGSSGSVEAFATDGAPGNQVGGLRDGDDRRLTTNRGRDQYWPYPKIEYVEENRWKWLKFWSRPEPIIRLTPIPEEDYQARLLENPTPWGVSLSGGGVRSASFCLGVVQEMHKHGMIHGEQRATYLSAVSGGSYLAGGMGIVTAGAIIGDDPPQNDQIRSADANQPAYSGGSVEERVLRNRTRYLTHGAGGPLAAVWRYLMGMLLNIFLIGLSLALVFVPVGWLYGWAIKDFRRYQRPKTTAAGTGHQAASHELVHHVFSTPSGLWIAIGILAGLSLVAGGLWVVARWKKRALNGLFAGTSVVMLVLAALLWFSTIGLPHTLDFVRISLPRDFFGYKTSQTGSSAINSAQTNVGIGAAIGGFASVLTGLGALRAGTATPPLVQKAAKDVQQVAASWAQRLANRYRNTLLNIAAAISGPLLVASGALSFILVGAGRPIGTPHVSFAQLAWVGGSATLLYLFWIKGNLNTWSLHPFYRRRLIAAYGIRRYLDSYGDIAAAELNGNGEHATLANFINSRPDAPEQKQADFPELLICAAANIADYGEAPTGSHVSSFVFSQRELGGPLVGAMDTGHYSELIQSTDDVTVPAAVAIAGAAVSPSMGKMTRAPLRFLLALLNIRLGVWLPNPRRVEARRARLEARDKDPTAHPFHTRPHPIYLVREMLGLNRLNDRYLYLTDGGHYENLGLVELLRRRCRWIWCIDASGDSVDTFNTLGQALALADSELGIHIDIHPEADMAPDTQVSDARARQGKPPFVRKPYSHGLIHYPHLTEPGRIVFIKAGVWASAPWEVQSFYERNHRFPCDPTSNQLYTAERFDAYRALGAAAMDAAWTAHATEFTAFRDSLPPARTPPRVESEEGSGEPLTRTADSGVGGTAR